MSGVPVIEIIQRLPHWKDGETFVVQLGDLYSGENRRFVIDLEVPGIAALGLCKIADITIEYLDLAERKEISVTLPVNVNVVPGDVAAGRVADPIVRAERLILDAQNAKSLAVEELLTGKIKEASGRLKGSAANLRREASLIPVTDERSAESLELIKAEADDIDALAKTAEDQDVMYSSKRMTESYSRKTRARNVRNQPEDPAVDPDSFLN
jgi:Ca-activated chloride channel family protein